MINPEEKRREILKVSVEALAVKCECSGATIWKLEKREFSPKHELLIKFAAAYGYTVPEVCEFFGMTPVQLVEKKEGQEPTQQNQ